MAQGFSLDCRPLGNGYCYIPTRYVIFSAVFVNLLVLKGLAPELAPIDR
jgi:hypothetical protein